MEWVAEKTGTGVLKAPVFTSRALMYIYVYIVKFYNIKNIHNFFEQGNSKIL